MLDQLEDTELYPGWYSTTIYSEQEEKKQCLMSCVVQLIINFVYSAVAQGCEQEDKLHYYTSAKLTTRMPRVTSPTPSKAVLVTFSSWVTTPKVKYNRIP